MLSAKGTSEAYASTEYLHENEQQIETDASSERCEPTDDSEKSAQAQADQSLRNLHVEALYPQLSI